MSAETAVGSCAQVSCPPLLRLLVVIFCLRRAAASLNFLPGVGAAGVVRRGATLGVPGLRHAARFIFSLKEDVDLLSLAMGLVEVGLVVGEWVAGELVDAGLVEVGLVEGGLAGGFSEAMKGVSAAVASWLRPACIHATQYFTSCAPRPIRQMLPACT